MGQTQQNTVEVVAGVKATAEGRYQKISRETVLRSIAIGRVSLNIHQEVFVTKVLLQALPCSVRAHTLSLRWALGMEKHCPEIDCSHVSLSSGVS